MKSQHNDIEKLKKDAIEAMKAKYDQTVTACQVLLNEAAALKNQLNSKSTALNKRNSEISEKIKSEYNKFIQSEEQKQNIIAGLDPTITNKVTALLTTHQSTLSEELGIATGSINYQSESHDTALKGVNYVLREAQKKLLTLENNVNKAKTPDQIESLQKTFQQEITYSVDLNTVKRSLEEAKQETAHINITLSTSAKTQQACLDEIKNQQSILSVLTELRNLQNLNTLKEPTHHNKAQIYDLTTKIQDWISDNQTLANTNLLIDTKGKMTSIKELFNKITLESTINQQANKENVITEKSSKTIQPTIQAATSTDDLLKKQQAEIIEAVTTKKIQAFREAQFKILIQHFKHYGNQLEHHKKGKESNRTQPLKELLAWLETQRNSTIPLKEMMIEMEKRADYKKVVSNKIRITFKNKEPTIEEKLRSTLNTFKTLAFEPDSKIKYDTKQTPAPLAPSSPNIQHATAAAPTKKPVSTHASLHQQMSPDIDLEKISADLRELSEKLKTQQPQTQAKPEQPTKAQPDQTIESTPRSTSRYRK